MFIFAILLLVIALAVLSWRLRQLTAVTTGAGISPNASGSALLVIDMQDGIINQTHYTNQKELIATIQQMIEGANQQQLDVIFIKHSINKHPIDTLLTAGQMQTGTPATELIEELADLPKATFHKHSADAFSDPAFEAYLLKQGISQLYLVGADASSCVYRTALGGLNRGYKVTVLEDGLFAVNKKQKAKMLGVYTNHGIKIVTGLFF